MDIGNLLNRNNLRTARENAGFSTVRATKKVSRSQTDLVLSWEEGAADPTWNQLAKLASTYGVATLLFFSDEEIEKRREIADYRSGIKDKYDDTDLKQLINITVSRQKWISQKLSDSGYEKNSLLGSGKKYKKPEQLASFIEETLGVSAKEISAITGNLTESKKKALACLIEKAEDKGIFVGKTLAQHKIEVKQMRGVFIADDFSPFIILNRKDALSAQIFTFVHELAHFYRRTDAISNTLDFRDDSVNADPEEVFCNKVAAEFLLPRSIFTAAYYSKEDIYSLAAEYKLSNIFVFYRLKDLGLIRSFEEERLENEILKETSRNVSQKESIKSDGGNYTNSMKDSNGTLFNKIISGAYFDNTIGYVEASKLLRFSPDKV